MRAQVDHDVAARGLTTDQATQNSLPSGSAITTWCPVNSCSVAAPEAPSRATSVMTQDQRCSGVPSPDTRRSRWSRFLAVFGSGTCSRLRRDATPVGSCSHAASIPSSNSSSNCDSHSLRVANGFGGGSSTYPAAVFQNAASNCGFEQSKVRSTRVSIYQTLGRCDDNVSSAVGENRSPGRPFRADRKRIRLRQSGCQLSPWRADDGGPHVHHGLGTQSDV